MNVDLIFATSSSEAEAARQASQTIAVVFATHADPVGVGHVVSLPRPGGSLTGLSVLQTDFTAKPSEVLKEAVPNATRLRRALPSGFWSWAAGCRSRRRTPRPNAVRRKARRRRERFSPAFEHLWRLRPPLFLSRELTATLDANGCWFRSNVEGGDIGCGYGERRRDHEVVVAASRLQAEPASLARLEDELSKLPAQKLAAGRMLRDS